MNLGLIPARWAALTPRRTTLIDITHQRRIDWATLDTRVRRLANGLRALGLRSGDRVAVLSRNSIEYQELYFAAGRAGLVLLPLNWRLSTEALRTLVADAEPTVLVASAEFRHVAEDLGRTVDLVCLLHCGLSGDGSYEELLASAPEAEPPWSEQVQEADPCFILYTGGTTGMAKGVVHSHGSVAAGMLNQTVAERIVPSDVYMLTGQMFHIPVVLSMNYLAHGCPVVLMNFGARQALEVIEQGPHGWCPQYYVQRHTGSGQATAAEIRQACMGMFSACELAAAHLMAAPEHTAALITSADNYNSPLMDRWRSSPHSLIGDGACALLLTRRTGFARLESINSVTLPQYEERHRGSTPLYPPQASLVGTKVDLEKAKEQWLSNTGADMRELEGV